MACDIFLIDWKNYLADFARWSILLVPNLQMEEEILFSHGILHFTVHLEKLKKEREEITQKIQNLNELKLLKVLARELQFLDMPQITNPENYPRLFANPFLEGEWRRRDEK